MAIQRADTLYPGLPKERAAEYVNHVRSLHGQPQVPQPPEDHLSEGAPLAAFVNDGRWLVQCPDCNSAEFASPHDPRFHCSNCLNAASPGWKRVIWPKDVAGIEAALAARPDPRTQGWRPGETVADLHAETASHLGAPQMLGITPPAPPVGK